MSHYDIWIWVIKLWRLRFHNIVFCKKSCEFPTAAFEWKFHWYFKYEIKYIEYIFIFIHLSICCLVLCIMRQEIYLGHNWLRIYFDIWHTFRTSLHMTQLRLPITCHKKRGYWICFRMACKIILSLPSFVNICVIISY